MMRSGHLLLLVALAACTTSSPPPAATSAELRPAAESSASLFEFRTGFWVSLHHHLRGEARRLPGALEGKFVRRPDPSTLPADERAAWESALAVYARTMAPRDLLFDEDLVKIKNALAEVDPQSNLSAVRDRLDADSLEALERAAPIYRSRIWPEHERTAKTWINDMAPLVARYGPAIANRLASLYEETWTAPIPVEVLPEAGAVGAYTTVPPTRVSISAYDPGLVGFPGLEILFHETSHAWSGSLRNPLAREAARRRMSLPDTLSHAVLFYVAGEVVRAELERAGKPGYVLYVDANHLWSREWEGLRDPIAAACDPWLRGERTREEALSALVEAVGKPSSAGS